MTQRRPAPEPTGAGAGRRTLVSGRVFWLFLLIVTVLISVAIPTRQLVDQQARLAELRSQIAANEAMITKLQAEVDRWGDPAFVKAQARDRLRYVMPNEVGYIVLEAEQVPAVKPVVRAKSSTPWYRVLWQSMRDAAATSSPTGAGR